MPIYEYVCDNCTHELEEVQKFSDSPLVSCPQCGEEKLKRKLSVGAFHLKGSGWYKDGYDGSSNKKPEDKKSETTPSKNTTNSSKESKPSSKESKPSSSDSSTSSSSSTSEKSTAA